MIYNYLDHFMRVIDLEALSEAELILSKQSWHGHHAEKTADVYGSCTLIIPDSEFEEWEGLDIGRPIIRESEWEAEEAFAKKHGLNVDPNDGFYDEFELGVVDGCITLLRMVLRNSGVTPKGASEFVHEFQDIAEVHTFAELLKFEEINADYQYQCGTVAGKLMALNRFAFDEWEIDDIKLDKNI